MWVGSPSVSEGKMREHSTLDYPQAAPLRVGLLTG